MKPISRLSHISIPNIYFQQISIILNNKCKISSIDVANAATNEEYVGDEDAVAEEEEEVSDDDGDESEEDGGEGGGESEG
jgi:hypothetical protein